MDTAADRPPVNYVQRLKGRMSDIEYDRETLLDDEGLVMSSLEFRAAWEGLRLASHPEALEKLIFMFDLQGIYDYYLSYNVALKAPYHNHYHVTCMVANCYEAARFEDLSEEDTRRLLIAALFHDFDHTAGKYDDMVNIKIASVTIAALKGAGLLQAADEEVIRGLILVTQYPFVHEPQSVMQRIIRDADLMQPYEEDNVKLVKQYLGLKKEVETKLGHQITTAEYVAGLERFFKEEVTWYTSWGLRKSQEHGYEAKVSRLLKSLGARGETS